jgi:hypothetical protein
MAIIKGSLSKPQTLCLMMVPLIAILMGATLVYLAVRCNASGGLQFDRSGEIICIRATEDQDPVTRAAIIVKIVVISIIIFTVAISMTICLWYVMQRQNEENIDLKAMKGHVSDIEKLLAEYPESSRCVVSTKDHMENIAVAV